MVLGEYPDDIGVLMRVTEFSLNAPRAMAQTIRHGEVLEVTYHGRPYAAVVPQNLWDRAAAALEREEQQKSKTK